VERAFENRGLCDPDERGDILAEILDFAALALRCQPRSARPKSRAIASSSPIKKILTAMGLPTEAPNPYPARPPPSEPSEPGDGAEYLN
jgi:hypothetical protein